MRLDIHHRPWAICTAAIASAACGTYFYLSHTGEIFGGTAAGLVLGISGYGCMCYAALLSLRKKFTTWRIGRAQTWMRGHLWLGLLSYPLIACHAGWSMGSNLASWLMSTFLLVGVTGIAGAIIQHYVPNLMTDSLDSETIYGESRSIRKQLAGKADDLIESLFDETPYGLLVPAMEPTAKREGVTMLVRLDEKAARDLQNAYRNTIEPYLNQPKAYGHEMHDRHKAEVLFSGLRLIVPKEAVSVIDGLENICKDKRDLDRQTRFHYLMYLWLLVHIPAAFLTLFLGLIHAAMSLHYR